MANVVQIQNTSLVKGMMFLMFFRNIHTGVRELWSQIRWEMYKKAMRQNHFRKTKKKVT